MKKKIDVILMAAGLSKRYGEENKLLVQYKGKPLLYYPLYLLGKGDQFNEVFMIYSSKEVEFFLKLEGKFGTLIKNEHPEIGISKSIRLGVAASTADFYMFLPADQPLLSEKTINKVVEKVAFEKIICPKWKGENGTPTVFSSVFRDDLLSLRGDQGGKYVMKKYPETVLYVEATDPGSLFDVDEKDDLERLNRQ